MNRCSNELAAWWDDVRVWMAFRISPWAVPVIVSATLAFGGAPASLIAAIALYSLMISYFGILLFGLPLYLLLRAYKLIHFWVAPVVGFVAGLAMMYLASSWLVGLPWLPIAGPAGAAVGLLLWLIARPDRDAAPSSASSSSN
ncbi:MAG: hypothetical protein K2Y71_13960 [Xanthobacteraceae bacterium]|nr:hypothetical protein [Xanthobacteraceae bacterium]